MTDRASREARPAVGAGGPPGAGNGSRTLDDARGPLVIDASVAHPARVYDFLLGGVDNFAVDREAAKRGSAALPGGVERARVMARSQRAFLAAAVRCLAGEMGVRQFLDIGPGIPNGDNVHAVAQQTAPASRVVYVDNDPVVLAHAHTLLKSTPQGATAYIHGDVRDPETILRQAAATLDSAQPVALILVGILHLIRDVDDPYGIVDRLLEAVPSGSYLALSHLASDRQPELAEVMRRANETMSTPFVLRSREQVARFLAGLEVLDPGIVTLGRWRWNERPVPPPEGQRIPAYCAIGRKP
jgi:S-adenosyl methyltransferase